MLLAVASGGEMFLGFWTDGEMFFLAVGGVHRRRSWRRYVGCGRNWRRNVPCRCNERRDVHFCRNWRQDVPCGRKDDFTKRWCWLRSGADYAVLPIILTIVLIMLCCCLCCDAGIMQWFLSGSCVGYAVIWL